MHRKACVRWAFFLACAPLAAQSGSYHLELSHATQGVSRYILINDSRKPIEAFLASQWCISGGESSGGDVLDGPGLSSDVHGPDGSRPPKSGFLEPGGWWDTMAPTTSTSKQGVETCRPQVDAVIFSDGSYQGEAAAVRALQAQRDGFAVEVSYWAQRFSETDLSQLNPAALRMDAENLVAGDSAEYLKASKSRLGPSNPPTALQMYWSGRQEVDNDVLLWLQREPASESRQFAAGSTSEGAVQRIASSIAEWKNKIDSDVAMKQLEVLLPLSDLLGADAGPARKIGRNASR